MMNRLLLLLIPFFLLSSCKDDEPIDYGDYLIAIVTYDGKTDNNIARFIYDQRDDIPPLKLFAQTSIPEKINIGQRCLLKYSIIDHNADGTINVNAEYFSPIIDDVVRQAPHKSMSEFPETDINVVSIWRSGMWINIYGWIPYTGKTFQLLLVADEDTIDDETVEMKLVYNTMNERTTFDRHLYASFDIKAAWLRFTCKEVNIKIGDKTYCFKKDNSLHIE